jgi:hypothetical protein
MRTIETNHEANIQYAQYIISVYYLQKTLQEEKLQAKGTVWIEFTQIRWFLGQSDRRLDLVRVVKDAKI